MKTERGLSRGERPPCRATDEFDFRYPVFFAFCTKEQAHAESQCLEIQSMKSVGESERRRALNPLPFFAKLRKYVALSRRVDPI